MFTKKRRNLKHELPGTFETRSRLEILRRIVAAGMEGMAAANSPHALGGPADGAVLPHCQNEVVAARGSEAAVLAQERPNEELIEPHSGDQEPSGRLHDGFPHGHYSADSIRADGAGPDASGIGFRFWSRSSNRFAR